MPKGKGAKGRAAKYGPLAAWKGSTYSVTVSSEGKKGSYSEEVTVPQITSIDNALTLFGGNLGPTKPEKDEKGKAKTMPAALLNFLQDAIESYVSRPARQRVQIQAKGPEKQIESFVKHAVKLGIDADAARKLAEQKFLVATPA